MKNRTYPLYFAGAALLLYGIFFVLPGIMGFYFAFTDWNSYSSQVNWIGLDNFREIFASNQQGYLGFIKNTVIFTVSTIVLKTIFALILALLLTEGVKRLTHFYRLIIYLPAVLPMLVVSLIFKSILNPETGFLNVTLNNIGLGFLAQPWLIDINWALPSVIGVDTWRGVGYIMVILIAGLQAIPRDYYEAASIDGANAWQSFFYITLPQLLPVLSVTTVLNLLYGLKVFDIVFVLTNGGPGRVTDTVYTAIFSDFSKGRYGVATALSSLMFVIMVFLGYFVLRLMHRENAG
jgi:raffinose/stachyose/melibiose transport system permease protein